jgi:DNA-binding NtrC family response regulator
MSVRILIVEDNENLRHDLQKAVCLGAPDRQIVTARNEFEAARLIAEMSFDVVITDIKLDEAGGTETGGLKVLQAVYEKDHATPVIVVSAYGKKEIPAEASADMESVSVEDMARKKGAFSYVPRPHRARDYLDVIREAILIALVHPRNMRQEA